MRSKKLAKRIILIGFGVLLVLFAALEAVIFVGSRSEIKHEPQAIIILGAMVWESGPSPALVNRMDVALEYWREHPELPIVVSGAQGSNEPVTEAQAMYEYLVAAGVPADQIYQEDASFSTAENLRNSRSVLEELGYDMDNVPVLVVSSDFHLARVRMLCRRYDLTADTLAAPMPTVGSAVYSWLRESLALVKSFFFD